MMQLGKKKKNPHDSFAMRLTFKGKFPVQKFRIRYTKRSNKLYGKYSFLKDGSESSIFF